MSGAGMEIERKYLIEYPDVKALAAMPDCVVWEIEQTYLRAPHGETRRVRRVVENKRVTYTRTFKRRVDAMSCVEDEIEIDRDAYDALLIDRDDARNVVQKTRYRIPYLGQLIEVDVYPFWTDRAICEIELPDEETPARLPPWLSLITEVTGDRAYSNAELARSVPRFALTKRKVYDIMEP